jgi:O-antigen/teichoic acid export membrane protein
MRVRGVLENSAFALAGDVATKAATALIMVAAARTLSIGQFALLATALSAAGVLTAGFDMGAQMLLTRDGVATPQRRYALFKGLLYGRLPLLVVTLGAAVLVGALVHHTVLVVMTVAFAALGAGQMLLTGALRAAQNLLPEAVLKLTSALTTLAACGICAFTSVEAGGYLLVLSIALGGALLPAVAFARKVMSGGEPLGLRGALVASVPLGVMSLATIAYYRSGPILLRAVSTPVETARFATASTLGFALLVAPNAITTGLLPKLAATDHSEHPALVRRAVGVGFIFLVGVAAVVWLLARPLLVALFGARYAPAAGALRILAASTIIIGPTGILGIALIARARTLPIYVQVGVSLVINIGVTVALGPKLGADGAALATLACELAAFFITLFAAHRHIPGLLGRPRSNPNSYPVTA